jgi:hypothetical protein
MKIISGVFTVVLVAATSWAIGFGTSFTEWMTKEDLRTLFKSDTKICHGVVENGDACEQILHFKAISGDNVEMEQETILRVPTDGGLKEIGLLTPTTLKIVGRRMCVNTMDMIYSERTKVFDIEGGKIKNPDNPHHPSTQEVLDFRNRARGAPSGDMPNYICMSLQTATGSGLQLLKVYGNEYLGFAVRRLLVKIGDKSSNMRIRILNVGEMPSLRKV